jgi:hypothetical protein
VLAHVAIALIGLVSFSAFAVDYGVMWAARRQAQNAADSAALAAAITLGYAGMDKIADAHNRALEAAGRNAVWGEAPSNTTVDFFGPDVIVCPEGAPAAGQAACVRVDVHRDQETGNPLPTFFSRLAGVTEQGVRATATAQVMKSDSSECVKPFAIPDKWMELRPKPSPWDPDDSFERYDKKGVLLNPADYYEAAGASGGLYGPNGTGFTDKSVVAEGGDHGRYVTLKVGNPQQTIMPGWYFPVVINPIEGPGADNYRDNIATCDPTLITRGTVLDVEPGNMVGPTRQGIEALVNQDLSADWNPNMYGPGKGGITGGCMAAGTCIMSPRLVAIPVFNPDAWDAAGEQGRTTVTVTNVIGFFIDKNMQGNNVGGWITHYPGPPRGGMSETPEAAFIVNIILVR